MELQECCSLSKSSPRDRTFLLSGAIFGVLTKSGACCMTVTVCSSPGSRGLTGTSSAPPRTECSSPCLSTNAARSNASEASRAKFEATRNDFKRCTVVENGHQARRAKSPTNVPLDRILPAVVCCNSLGCVFLSCAARTELRPQKNAPSTLQCFNVPRSGSIGFAHPGLNHFRGTPGSYG